MDQQPSNTVSFAPGQVTLAAAERVLLLATLKALDGNIKNSAKALGISRSAIYQKMKRQKIHVDDGEVIDLIAEAKAGTLPATPTPGAPPTYPPGPAGPTS